MTPPSEITIPGIRGTLPRSNLEPDCAIPSTALLVLPANVIGGAPSERNTPVCRSSIASGLLILVFATAAFGCATGSGGEPPGFCAGKRSQRLCTIPRTSTPSKSRVSTLKSRCGPALKSSGGPCSLRSLAQFQVAELRHFEISSPLQRPTGKALRPSNTRLIVLSIGSPETDRGPPHS